MTTNFKAKPLICRKLILVSFLSFSGCFCLAKKSSQQQFFRVKPHDVEVGQGGSVIISCEVGNRRGRVQWTKDGLTLGKSYCKCQNSSQPHFVLSLSCDNSISEFLSPFVLQELHCKGIVRQGSLPIEYFQYFG